MAEESESSEPAVDWPGYEEHKVVPAASLTKKQLKAVKINLPRGPGIKAVCTVCCTVHTNTKSIDNHIAGRGHQRAIKEQALDDVLTFHSPVSRGYLELLSHFLEGTYSSVRGDSALREGVLQELRGLCGVGLALHGSTASGFSLTSSNLNLSLELPLDTSPQGIASAMVDLVQLLKVNDALYSDVVTDFQAFNKIPRILFKHKSSGLCCETRAMAGNPVALARLLHCYGDADQRAVKLGVLFSHWAKVCGLEVQEEGCYPAHMFVVMVIHFLQQTTPPVLPVLHQGGEESEGLLSDQDLDKYRASASEWSSDNKQSLGELWLALLQYYTTGLDRTKLAVTLRQKEPLLKSSRLWNQKLAVEDPMLTRSNLAKAAFYDKVLEYLTTSLKATAVYFIQGGQSSPPSLEFSAAQFTIQSRPSACVSCKQVKHVFKNCPSEVLPDLKQLHVPRPSHESLISLGKVFKSHKNKVAPDARETRFRQEQCERVLRDVGSAVPGADLQLFGSSVNGFGASHSDLDLCLVLPRPLSTEPTKRREEQVVVVENVAKLLRERRHDYSDVSTITTARVPIVKFVLSKHDLECDISLENRLALRNTAMLRDYSRIDSRARVLGYTVKAFAKSCDIGDASVGSLSSYAYILLMIHFLQQTTPPVLPVLQKLPLGGVVSGPIIDQWDCYYYEYTSEQELKRVWPEGGANRASVGELWLEFLTYFLSFDWNNKVVTINQAAPRSKVDKWWLKHLCIEDPFNLDHNLGGSVGPKMRAYILDRFKDALVYHSSPRQWSSMREVMSEGALVGDNRAPKFLICHLCNGRGHRAQQCTAKRENYRRSRGHQATPNYPPPPQYRQAPPTQRRQPPPPQYRQPPPGRYRQAPPTQMRTAGVPYTAHPVQQSHDGHVTVIPSSRSRDGRVTRPQSNWSLPSDQENWRQ